MEVIGKQIHMEPSGEITGEFVGEGRMASIALGHWE